MSDSKELQDEIRDAAHKIWLAGLGALATAEEEGSRLFRNLMERGERFEESGREKVGDVRDRVGGAARRAENAFDRLEETIERRVESTLTRMGVPTKDEISTLTHKVEELTRSVEALNRRS